MREFDGHRPTEEEVVKREKLIILTYLFRLLPKRWQRAVELTVVDNKKARELSGDFGVVDSRVQQLKARGLKELKRGLKGRRIEGSDF